jgi:hypothetical protein
MTIEPFTLHGASIRVDSFAEGRMKFVKAVSQLLWPDKDREVWFSLEENHEKAHPFGLHQLRNSPSPD